MAGASMNDIKARIKSVESTMQITKAMELVATSKLRRARENAEKARPYHDILTKAIDTVRNSAIDCKKENNKSEQKRLIIVIAGDRGLAGGYNANVFKIAEKLAQEKSTAILPIGKKALEYFKRRSAEIFSEEAPLVSDVGVGASMKLADDICNVFFAGEISEVFIVYTKFVSMISQLPLYEQLLPLEKSEGSEFDPIIEEDPEELLLKILPQYVGGIIYASACEAIASECGARRTAMNSANKNAAEMIDTLMLKYNRARQAVITQEITEIVSGAEAL
ncbi:MAG: ATP synthase F1 subunit gamma [Clostridia bacterium]|nr:ATP synthase F1 subunit gamma [Clostridia bacterium]